MSSLKKISILSVILITMSTAGYGATVVVPRVSVVRVPTSRPTVNTPKPSVNKSTSNKSITTKPSNNKSSTVEKSFSEGSDDSCGLWDWITNNIEYLKRVLLGE